jgi:hypothetical protein
MLVQVNENNEDKKLKQTGGLELKATWALARLVGLRVNAPVVAGSRPSSALLHGHNDAENTISPVRHVSSGAISPAILFAMKKH